MPLVRFDMNTSDEIKFGFVGLGWPGEQHANAATVLPGARVEAACDVDAVRLQKFASKYSARTTYSEYAEMLANPDVTAVVISLPNFLHYSTTMAALQAGKHVLCEKPPTMTVPEIEAIRHEALQRNLIYFFGRQSRFHSRLLAAKRFVEEGRLGRVYFVKAERIRSRGTPVGIAGWFVEKAKSGGGAMIDIGVHALDAAWYLLGCPRPVSVSAQVSTHFRGLVPEGVKFDVEDSGFAFLRFEDGLVMHLEVTWAANVTDAIPKSPWAGHELENTTLYGERATLCLNPPKLFTMEGTERHEHIYEGDDNAEKFAEQFERQMSNFIDSMRTGAAPICNVDQAVSLMKMLMAIYESSASGAEVRLT